MFLDSETFQPRFLLAQDLSDLRHRALPSPSFTSTFPAPLVSSHGVVGAFGVPHPGHPSSACPSSPYNTFLSLALPSPSGSTSHWSSLCFPRVS